MLDILSFFPSGMVPQGEQERILREYEAVPDFVRVVCLVAPVAAGKTPLGSTIAEYDAARWGGATILNFDNTLHRQWAKQLPHFMQAPYRGGHSARAWDDVKSRWAVTPLRLANTFSYMSLRSYTPSIIIDEAHKSVESFQDMESVKLWKHLSGYPDGIRSILDLARWAASVPKDEMRPEIKNLKAALKRNIEDYTFDVAVEEYRGHERERIRVWPLTPRNNKPIFWPPSKVKRIVLMSATLSDEDIYDLGLDKASIHWIRCSSRIPVEARPAVYEPFGNMGFATQTSHLPNIIKGIKLLAERHADEKGLIHVTYSLGAKLAPYLVDNPRFVFHSKDNKQARFETWQKTSNGIFIAAGFAEGIDLPYDKCRWQVVAKILWPNKSDIAVAAKLRLRPQWYGWAAMKALMQMYGRVCRQPDDFGVTYIITEEFETLLRKYSNFATPWFLEALE